MKKVLSFDDVLIKPSFSTINSRKDVNLDLNFLNYKLSLPVISSNMDTVTEGQMAQAMGLAGGVGALHRFCSIEENIKQFKSVTSRLPIISLGVSKDDIERAEALYNLGARNFVIDVAHGATMITVNAFKALREVLPKDARFLVGNFATGSDIDTFVYHTGKGPSAFKVGIGGGSMCTTRMVTGCGLPTLASVLDCVKTYYPIVADGGIRSSGDIAKALAAGARAVMIGGMLSGTDETPGEICDEDGWNTYTPEELRAWEGPLYKKYRGSASQESYEVQGKVASHRSAEGESTLVRYKGPVQEVLQQIEGGLRSAFTYVGASNLEEFQRKAELCEISLAGMAESKPHGKR